jgi:hypothetical protein
MASPCDFGSTGLECSDRTGCAGTHRGTSIKGTCSSDFRKLSSDKRARPVEPHLGKHRNEGLQVPCTDNAHVHCTNARRHCPRFAVSHTRDFYLRFFGCAIGQPYLNRSQRVGDPDVGVELSPRVRHSDERTKAHLRYASDGGRRFSNFSDLSFC